MTFTNPEVLYALFAVLIPLIIHLFNFRPAKKVYFSNISLLKQVYTQTKKRSRLKHLIVLFLRILAIASLVIAFAGPHFGAKNKIEERGNITAIYIDNSFSMQAGGSGGSIFDISVDATRNFLKNSDKDANFIIKTNTNEKNIVLNKDEAITKIDELKIQPEFSHLSSIIESLNNFNITSDSKIGKALIFSDYQNNFVANLNKVNDSLINYSFILLNNHNTSNISIDSVYSDSPFFLPSSLSNIKVKLTNNSDDEIKDVALSLFVNNKNSSISSVDFASRESKVVDMSFYSANAGWKSAVLKIDDYPVVFDNELYFTPEVKNRINVQIINGKSENIYLSEFYSVDSVFNISQTNYGSVDYSSLENYRLIILNSLEKISGGMISQLKDFVNSGGNLMIFPSEKNSGENNRLLSAFNAGKYGDMLIGKQRVNNLNTNSGFYHQLISEIPENADLPEIKKYYRLASTYNSRLETLAETVNGDIFIARKSFGNGLIYFSAVPLNDEWSNFTTNKLFTVVMYGAAVKARTGKPMYVDFGSSAQLNINLPKTESASEVEKVYKMSLDEKSDEFIPLQNINGNSLNLNFSHIPQQAGIYELYSEKDKPLAKIAMNYSREESDFRFMKSENLELTIEKSGISNFRIINIDSKLSGEVINSGKSDGNEWLLFVIFALLFLLGEVLVLRLWP